MVHTAQARRGMAMVIQRSLLILLVLLTSGTTAFGQDATTLGTNEGPVTIEWESLDASYRIEVRRDGQVFIDTEQTESEIKLNLAPGFYEYRIHVLNPFGKEVSASEWLPLNVRSSRIPYFRVRTPLIIWEGDTGIEMIVESSNLREGTIFQLSRGDRRISAEWQGDGNFYTVLLSESDIEPGSWDLEAADPSGETFVHPEALIVRPTRSPNIQYLDTQEIPPEGLVPIEITGEAFDSEMSVRFEGPAGELPVTAVEIIEGNRALVYLDMNEAQPGDYTLIVSNPAGDETRWDKAIIVTEPIIEEIIKKQPRFDFQIGYAPTFIFTPDNYEILPVFIGFDIAGVIHSGWKAPFLRAVGLEIRAFAGASGPGDQGDINGIGSLDLSGYYRPLVKGKVAPVFLLGIGNMWSGYAKGFGIKNILFIRTGIGMDIVNQRKLIRIGLNLSFASVDTTFPVVSLMFRRGFRF